MLNNKTKVLSAFFLMALFMMMSSCALHQTDKKNPLISSDTEALNIETLDSALPHLEAPQVGIASTQLNEPTIEITIGIVTDTVLMEPALAVNDVWTRLRDNLSFDLNIDNKSIRQQRNWFVKHPEHFQRVSHRAKRYLFHVANQIEAQNMPAELALLPIVESAYDPFAYSHGRASGMWQFIPATGKHFGLQQDWWYDGRRDVVKSTDAALAYMRYLHKRFNGDWLHALAAYNSGEGNVSKAIKRNRARGKATDFWSLKLPPETQAYVPKMIALAQILHDPAAYGITLPVIANEPYFESVDTGSQIDLAQAADLAGITLDEMYLLNPGFNQWATRPEGPHQLNVPVAKAAAFKESLATLPANKRINWLRYKIKFGDSVSLIAKRYKTTSKMLREVNNLRGNSIRAGEVLFVPVASKGAEAYVFSATERLNSKQNRTSLSNRIKRIHITQSGDSFWKIARHYGVQTRDVARWNSLGTTDTLRVGQKLVIWSKAQKTAHSSRQVIRKLGYKVRNGDSLARIAQKFNIKISDIESWNGINRKKYLQPGQSLKLYVDITQASL